MLQNAFNTLGHIASPLSYLLLLLLLSSCGQGSQSSNTKLREGKKSQSFKEINALSTESSSPILSCLDSLNCLFKAKGVAWEDSVSLILNSCAFESMSLYSDGNQHHDILDHFKLEDEAFSEIEILKHVEDSLLFLSVIYFKREGEAERSISLWKFEELRWQLLLHSREESARNIMWSKLRAIDINFDGENDLMITNAFFSASRTIQNNLCILRENGTYRYVPGLKFSSSIHFGLSPERKELFTLTDGGVWGGQREFFFLQDNKWKQRKKETWTASPIDSFVVSRVIDFESGMQTQEQKISLSEWDKFREKFESPEGFILVE